MKMFNRVSVGATVLSLVFGLVGQNAFAAGPAAVNLGTAGNFVILAKTGISTTGATYIVGDIGVNPAAASYITGFGLNLPYSSAFSTSALINGKVYAADYAVPTPANLTTAVLDMQNAYTDAAGRAPNTTELGAGNIGGLTLAPGVYKWGTGLTIPTDVTLSGGANDVWIFQVAQNLTVSSGAKIVLSGGAQANNIFWVVAGQTTLGTTSVFNGNILSQTLIAMNTGATLNGRALAQTAVTLDSNSVTVTNSTVTPSPPAQTPPPPASTDPNAALRDQLNTLFATLRSLQQQAAQQQGCSGQQGCAVASFGQQVRAIATDLNIGSRGSNVQVLQQFLISQGKGSAAQALAQNGATTYFGALTRAALAEFQASVGITPASGYFGAKTRGYINSH